MVIKSQEDGRNYLDPRDPNSDIDLGDGDKSELQSKRIHPVPGYDDKENMWEKLINIEKVGTCPPQPSEANNNRN
jgi:hypothetical protein